MSTPLPQPEQTSETSQKSGSRDQRTRERRIYMTLIGFGVLITLFFGLRVLHIVPALRHLRPSPPPVGPAAIEIWMTVPHVARITHVPEGYLWQQLDLPALGNRRHSLETLQEVRNQSRSDTQPILPLLQQAVDDFQQNHPQPPPPSEHTP